MKSVARMDKQRRVEWESRVMGVRVEEGVFVFGVRVVMLVGGVQSCWRRQLNGWRKVKSKSSAVEEEREEELRLRRWWRWCRALPGTRSGPRGANWTNGPEAVEPDAGEPVVQ